MSIEVLAIIATTYLLPIIVGFACLYLVVRKAIVDGLRSYDRKRGATHDDPHDNPPMP
ncbi:hypothetical protein HLV38_04525 [Berryella wangjianweii]|uniref:Uncharacterized protein n=1 Tax=Berryella wangjianweii TaxID=2734634 RepID=A0A6M8J6C0_9ACTN|nr:hypothetical protein [Berryella wangjianweii]QKF07466.1 hypothetical protein HLV38_04525 [Berryella wangjianweii]